jgi:hypothetical protein
MSSLDVKRQKSLIQKLQSTKQLESLAVGALSDLELVCTTL